MPPISGNLRRGIWILALLISAAIVGFWYFGILTPRFARRTLRIGFEEVPPVQIRTDRGFAGLAVEIVQEAAKRAGVPLQWVETGTSSEESLRRGLVDLWPIMIDLPERRKRVHITRPWLHTGHALVLRAEMEPPGRNFAGSIALTKMPVHTRLARQEFPGARLVPFAEGEEVVKQVCRGTVAAGFLEDRAALAALREKLPECATVGLRVQPLPHLTLPLGVGSTFQAAAAADRIRDQIGSMFRDGTLAATMTKYSYHGLDDTWPTYDLLVAVEHERWMAWGTGALAVGLTLAMWQTFALRQRKRAESALRESEERFRAIFQQAGVGVALVNLEGKVELANKRYCDVVGYTLEDLPKKGTQEITHRADLKEEAIMLPRLLSGELRSFSVEKRYTQRDGRRVWATMCKSLVRDGDGRPKSFIAVVEDITERKQAEQALLESESRARARAAELQAIMDATPAMILIAYDRECKYISGNRMAHELLRQPSGSNFSMSAPIGERPGGFRLLRDGIEIPPADLPVHRAAFSGMPVRNWEVKVVFENGSAINLLGNAEPMLDEDGCPRGAVAVLSDITERKQLEAALRESELQYKEVFDNFSECIFVLDVCPDGRFKIAGFNPAEEKATGLSNIEVAGKYIEDVFAEDVAKRVIPHYRRCLEVGTVINYDEELNLPVGARYFHTNLIPVRNEAGCIHRIVGCCLDFTNLKRTQEEAFARQKLESVGTLAGGIAHDFNNLLGGVLAQADLALAEFHAGASPEEELDAIKEVAIRGSEIVRQLMIYSGQESEVPGLIDVSRVVEDMLGLLKVSISKHVTLEIKLSRDLPFVRGRSAQVQQIAMNLVTNASEAIGDRDGVIGVTTRRMSVCRAAEIWIGVDEGDYVLLEVSDTGGGMSPETQGRVFDPFFTTKSAGHGLGLAVVQGIVRNVGGTINLASELGRGTTIQIFLPCADAVADSINETISGTREPAQTSQTFTVLVVEDEDPLRRAVAKMLRKTGFDVLEVANGAAAIDLLRANSGEIDLILLDMTIPGPSSQEVVAEAAQVRQDLKVVLTSAYSEEMAAATISTPLVRAFIRKPFQLRGLAQTLRDVLSS